MRESVDEDRDLGVIIQNSLKADNRCAKEFKSTNSMLDMMIKRSFVNTHK